MRIADNYWMREPYGNEQSKAYQSPLDIGFERDIDPTILYPEKILEEKSNDLSSKLMGEEIDIGECDEDQLQAWPFFKNPSDDIEDLIFRKDEDGREYNVLYEHRSTTQNYSKDEEARMMHGLRRQEFRFFAAVFIPDAQVDEFFEHFEKEEDMDISNFKADMHVDEAYLLESLWADVWRKPKWSENFYGALKKFDLAKPVDSYQWESHLDKSMPDGCSAYIPSSWLKIDLQLSPQEKKHLTFVNEDGIPIFTSGKGVEGGSAVFCDRETIEAYLSQENLSCIWLYLSERNSWPRGDNEASTWRRIEGLACLNKDKSIRKLVWEKNRTSEDIATRTN